MTHRLKRIGPLQAGKVLAILYGLLSLIIEPFVFLAVLMGSLTDKGQQASASGMIAAGALVVIGVLLPIVYAIFGFILGALTAAVYNFVVRWVGGLEFEFESVPMTASTVQVPLPGS